MNNRLLIIIGALVVAGVLMLLLLPVHEENNSLVELNASVAFNGTCFTVSNNDTFDYLNAQLTLNSYYSITGINLRAGETYKIWPAEFAHVNRRHFPAGQMPRQFAINCSLIGDGIGFYSVKLDAK